MRVCYSVPVMEAGKILNDKVFHGKGNPKHCRRIAYLGYFKGSEDIKKWKATFIGAFLTQYPEQPHIIGYIAKVIGKDKPLWSDLTKSNLVDTVEWMKANLCAKSVKVCCARLKAVLNRWKEEVEMPSKTFAQVLTVKDEPSQGVYLNKEDITLLENYEPKTNRERIVQAQWLCEYYLGGRRSDLELLKDEMIDEERRVITYVSQKTKSLVTVPLHSNFMQFYPSAKEKWFPLSVYIKTIREVCKGAGITERVSVFLAGKREVGSKCDYVGSHTARRSFACNMYRAGVDILHISRAMGHSSIAITQRYLVIEDTQFSDAFLSMYYK